MATVVIEVDGSGAEAAARAVLAELRPGFDPSEVTVELAGIGDGGDTTLTVNADGQDASEAFSRALAAFDGDEVAGISVEGEYRSTEDDADGAAELQASAATDDPRAGRLEDGGPDHYPDGKDWEPLDEPASDGGKATSPGTSVHAVVFLVDNLGGHSEEDAVSSSDLRSHEHLDNLYPSAANVSAALTKAWDSHRFLDRRESSRPEGGVQFDYWLTEAGRRELARLPPVYETDRWEGEPPAAESE